MANLGDTSVNGELRVSRGVKLLGPLLRFFKPAIYGDGEGIEYVNVINGSVNINANSGIQYNLSTLLGDFNKFHLNGTRIEVRVLDEEAGSPTNGVWVNSEAIISSGMDGSVVKIHNYSNAVAKCRVYIAVPTNIRVNA